MDELTKDRAVAKLRRIVEDAKGDDLERAEAECRRVKRKFGQGRILEDLEKSLASYKSGRIEWQAAHDLLEQILADVGLD